MRLEMDHTHEYNWVNNGDGTHTGTCYCTEAIENQKHADSMLSKDYWCDKCGALMVMSQNGGNYNTQFKPDNPTDDVVKAGLVVSDCTVSDSQAASIVGGAADGGVIDLSAFGAEPAHQVVLAKDISAAAGSGVAGTVTVTAVGAASQYAGKDVQFIFAHIRSNGVEFGTTTVEGNDVIGTIYVKDQSPFVLLAVYDDTETPDVPGTPDVPEKPERPTFSWFFAWTKVMEQINKRIICLFSWIINL